MAVAFDRPNATNNHTQVVSCENSLLSQVSAVLLRISRLGSANCRELEEPRAIAQRFSKGSPSAFEAFDALRQYAEDPRGILGLQQSSLLSPTQQLFRAIADLSYLAIYEEQGAAGLDNILERGAKTTDLNYLLRANDLLGRAIYLFVPMIMGVEVRISNTKFAANNGIKTLPRDEITARSLFQRYAALSQQDQYSGGEITKLQLNLPYRFSCQIQDRDRVLVSDERRADLFFRSLKSKGGVITPVFNVGLEDGGSLIRHTAFLIGKESGEVCSINFISEPQLSPRISEELNSLSPRPSPIRNYLYFRDFIRLSALEERDDGPRLDLEDVEFAESHLWVPNWHTGLWKELANGNRLSKLEKGFLAYCESDSADPILYELTDVQVPGGRKQSAIWIGKAIRTGVPLPGMIEHRGIKQVEVLAKYPVRDS